MADLVSYLVFDVEAIADGELIAKAKYGDAEMSSGEAIAKFGAERLEQRGNDVLPPTWMLPISVAIAKVDSGFRLLDLTVLDAPAYRPHVITDLFWKGWKHYSQPTLVTFNGRGYDLPVLNWQPIATGSRCRNGSTLKPGRMTRPGTGTTSSRTST